MPFPSFLEISAGLDLKPFSGTGSKFSVNLFSVVGLCTSNFEKIQEEIILLFDQLCGGYPGRISAMGAIIGATSSFNVKMDLVTQAARSFISDEKHQKSVLGWLKLCKKAAEVRNKIAHGQPTSSHFVFNGESRNGIFWAPSLFDTKKSGWPVKMSHDWEFCWNECQLREYATTFFALRTMLMTMREELSGTGDEPMPQVLDPDTMMRGSG